jgi:DNA-binding PadR family transcriptional regulator
VKNLLTPVELRVLSLVTEERTGREVARLYGREAGEQISFATLYSALRRMRTRGWVRMRADPDLDSRLRLFVATADGAEELERARDQYATLAAFGAELA